ncbi:hypothetical protein DCAR_0624230 [Daucus carota subsp. sativus]|uniref:Uncharacterized protein n=1 Tax=Daucus carota subsp. sativus TaxID=79200 RepID=A0A161YDA7_DAUCS|nr:PREDICTED: uncharacterized protein LOC108226075 [Daucus carota subsp. sativus]WOH04818.1 hypothetical protein DCAR_0624230 [Daucus carota subsp. sativus]
MKNAKTKKQPKIIYYLSAPLRLLSSCRDFYTNTLCDCGRIGHVGQMASYVAIPHQLSHSSFSRSSSFKESKDIEDLRELIRVMTLKNTEKHRTNANDGRKVKAIVDNSSSGRSYSGGVGQIGRIDEDAPCEFVQVVDVNKSSYPRCRSYARTTTRRVLL